MGSCMREHTMIRYFPPQSHLGARVEEGLDSGEGLGSGRVVASEIEAPNKPGWRAPGFSIQARERWSRKLQTRRIRIGFGRIVASKIEAPNILVNLV